MIGENLQKLFSRINGRCKVSGRDVREVKLVAVSKFFGINAINEANELGITEFGENRAQELDIKYERLGNKITWHFIGHLQRNKVRIVIPAASYIHSVDSLQLASEINKYAVKNNKVQKVLLQVKTSEEETKFGIQSRSELFDLVNYCKEFENIQVEGLMTIAPLTENDDEIRQSFRQLRKLKDDLNLNGFNLKELSMGMTSDFEIAIEEGATMLRIGSAIFGERDYSKDWKES